MISHGAQSGLLYELLTSFVKRKPRHLMFDIGGLNGSRINNYETPLIRYALRRSPAIIVHSSRQLDLYRQHYPNLLAKSTFIPFGADFYYFYEGLEININKRVWHLAMPSAILLHCARHLLALATVAASNFT